MSNRFNKSQNDPPSDDEEFTKLTLTFGSSNEENPKVKENENPRGVTTYDFFAMESQVAINKGHYPMQYGQGIDIGGSSSAYGGTQLGCVAPVPAYGTDANFLPEEAFGKNFSVNNDRKTCEACNRKHTPLWRRGREHCQRLCIACGLKYLRYQKKDA